MLEYDIIVKKLSLFREMYEIVRIVDPLAKKVFEVGKECLTQTDIVCHDFWKKNMVCDNCISLRAINEDNTIYKMEHNDNKIYIVTSIPVKINEKSFVVELLKDVSKSFYGYMQQDELKTISMLEYMGQLAVVDELTGLFNRRFINERFPVDILSASLNNEPLTILFADLDFFKVVNDTYGHNVGDNILVEFADELMGNIRKGVDWAARYGGEEFIVCLPNTDYDKARVIAERIRMNISQRKFKAGEKEIHITCSFGVYTVNEDNSNQTMENIIDHADKKLYEAKKGGRNRVE